MAAEVQAVLGTNYLATVPQVEQAGRRQQPFILADAFRGIPLREVRTNEGVVFANPDGVKLQLNVYRPMQIGRYPAIVILYGGAWQRGSPNSN
ncbi:hypothetical protein QT972_21975 [Microcoleus sp. herbarium7]|uniref:hypothetical protein n=1 Tax=Microcoleus sp. herbarium7 TaxID=3055435 RepID=UPI002FD3A2D4